MEAVCGSDVSFTLSNRSTHRVLQEVKAPVKKEECGGQPS